jgi:hypothetical protein
MGYALYRLDMVGVLMARLKYLSLDIFLRYFDNWNWISCVSMDPFSKKQVKIGKYPYGLCNI